MDTGSFAGDLVKIGGHPGVGWALHPLFNTNLMKRGKTV